MTSITIPLLCLRKLPRFCNILGTTEILNMDGNKENALIVEWRDDGPFRGPRKAFFRIENGDYLEEAW